ncbi:MAG: precorrin-2 C(20)-methyltransferase [Spirochaetota bacterium]
MDEGNTRGWLCGIGLGPGDPGLVTVHALHVIESADLLMIPRAEGRKEGGAGRILAAYLDLDHRKNEDILYPLTADRQVVERFWKRTAARAVDQVRRGMRVAFLTIGDPLVYSTWQHLLRQVTRIAPELDVRIVPGISSYSLAAALSTVSLAEAEGEMVVCPAGSPKLKAYLCEAACTVVMKIGGRLPELTGLLERIGQLEHAVLVCGAGTNSQRIVRGRALADLPGAAGGMAVLIVRPERGDV